MRQELQPPAPAHRPALRHAAAPLPPLPAALDPAGARRAWHATQSSNVPSPAALAAQAKQRVEPAAVGAAAAATSASGAQAALAACPSAAPARPGSQVAVDAAEVQRSSSLGTSELVSNGSSGRDSPALRASFSGRGGPCSILAGQPASPSARSPRAFTPVTPTPAAPQGGSRGGSSSASISDSEAAASEALQACAASGFKAKSPRDGYIAGAAAPLHLPPPAGKGSDVIGDCGTSAGCSPCTPSTPTIGVALAGPSWFDQGERRGAHLAA